MVYDAALRVRSPGFDSQCGLRLSGLLHISYGPDKEHVNFFWFIHFFSRPKSHMLLYRYKTIFFLFNSVLYFPHKYHIVKEENLFFLILLFILTKYWPQRALAYIVCQCMALSYRILFQLDIIYFQNMYITYFLTFTGRHRETSWNAVSFKGNRAICLCASSLRSLSLWEGGWQSL